MTPSLQSPAYIELRRLLIEARLAAGLTQAQVADRMKRPQSFISKLESEGGRYLDVTEFLDLCEAIGVSAVDVVAALEESAASSTALIQQSRSKA